MSGTLTIHADGEAYEVPRGSSFPFSYVDATREWWTADPPLPKHLSEISFADVREWEREERRAKKGFRIKAGRKQRH